MSRTNIRVSKAALDDFAGAAAAEELTTSQAIRREIKRYIKTPRNIRHVDIGEDQVIKQIRIDDDLYNEFKTACANDGVKSSDVVRDIIMRKLRKVR